MDESSQPTSTRGAAAITVAATLIAAAPHAFFPLPFELHMHGLDDGFFGISIWSTAILAGFAFFFGADFSSRRTLDSARPETAAAVLVGAVVALAVTYGVIFENFWTDMTDRRPWGELRIALPLYAGLWALGTIFWQGFVQHVVCGALPRVVGVVAAVVGPVFVALPFFVQSDIDSVMRYLAAVCAGHLVTALTYALGFRVAAAALVGAGVGLLFVWFQQAVLL